MSLSVISQPIADPPTGALPPLPTQSRPPRKSLPRPPSRLKTVSALPVSPTLSAAAELPTQGRDTPGLKSGLPIPANAEYRAVTINAFPQPPTSSPRRTTSSSATSPISLGKRFSDASRGSVVAAIRSRTTPRASVSSKSSINRGSDVASLLNATGDGRSIPIVSNKRASDGQSSVPSPPQSRSSSANGSYSTSATTFEEADDDRGRTKYPDDPAMDSPRNSRAKEAKGNVLVSVRVRPDTSASNPPKSDGEWMVDSRRSLITFQGKEGGDYIYDNVFGTYDDNARVYDSAAKRLVRRVMEGYHGTVFAYGMTGTGKTFSMQGTMSSPGVIPLAITDIFSYIRETPHREFLLRVSYLEIYNEKIHDLLAGPVSGISHTPQEEIKLREDSNRGVYATPLKEEIVQSPTQLLRVIHRGDLARRTSSTQFNARSSRSHAVVQIVVESRERVSASGIQDNKRVAMLPNGVRVSTLSLIDLAGSERAADDKERRTEGAHINKSLLTLGTVIAKLSGNKDKNGNPTDKDGKHLPYRDSKLTRLLQPALSGGSLVSILCTIQIGSQSSSASANTHIIETMNTLKFAARARNNIVSHAKRAVEEIGSGVNAGLLERYRNEIANLRSRLENQQKSGVATEENTIEKEEKKIEREAETRHEEQMLEMQLARTALKERIEHLNRLILCSKSTGVNSGTIAGMDTHGRLSGGTGGEGGARSVRSSASHSTLGNLPSMTRHPSTTSVGGSPSINIPIADDEEDLGEFGDGRASLQAQNRALQSDLQDKNRYIATLEKRLLQARRSSHSRTSTGLSKVGHDENELMKQLEEKDITIADLQKTVSALRSAMRQRSVANMSRENSLMSDVKPKKLMALRRSTSSSGSNRLSTASQREGAGTLAKPSAAAVSPVMLLSPDNSSDTKRKSVDEMSKMLDEMIQDKVESGHLVKGKTGSVRIPRRSSSSLQHSRRPSSVGPHETTTKSSTGTAATMTKEIQEHNVEEATS